MTLSCPRSRPPDIVRWLRAGYTSVKIVRIYNFAIKEQSRRMSSPSKSDWERLKRLGRYIIGRMRYVSLYPYQEKFFQLDTWPDSDFAGCPLTRKSTSAGVAMLEGCNVKLWSSTQGIVALSSGEAGLYAIVIAGTQSIGIQSILGDLDVQLDIEVYTDADAAKGIAERKGVGKVKHIETHQLWI